MSAIKYAFVLPAYKAKYLREAIASILAQSYQDFELIIVNDASPDDVDSIVLSFQDSRIKYYVNTKNIGGTDLVAQWNHSISYANCDYLILASDDDVYDKDYLRKMNCLIEKYPDVSVFRPRVKIIDAFNNPLSVECLMKERTNVLEYMYLLHRRYISAGIPYYIFKKSSLDSLNGFVWYALAWGSDDATVIKLAMKGGASYFARYFVLI